MNDIYVHYIYVQVHLIYVHMWLVKQMASMQFRMLFALLVVTKQLPWKEICIAQNSCGFHLSFIEASAFMKYLLMQKALEIKCFCLLDYDWCSWFYWLWLIQLNWLLTNNNNLYALHTFFISTFDTMITKNIEIKLQKVM